MKILLLGSTDLTLAVAKLLHSLDLQLAGVMSAAVRFSISYAPDGVSNTRAAPISQWCMTEGIPWRQYQDTASLRTFRRETGAELALAAGWYHMIPRPIRDEFALGCLGLHASLLPKYRGGAPLSWAILNGEPETGMTLFQLSDHIDDGPVFGQRKIKLQPRTYVGDLVAEATSTGLSLVQDCLPRIAKGNLTPSPQQGSPTYCLQRLPADGLIDWTQPARRIESLVRAASRPYPGAYSILDGTQIHVWRASLPVDAPVVFGAPGQLFVPPASHRVLVVAGDGLLELEDATDAAGKPVLDLLRKRSQRRFTER